MIQKEEKHAKKEMSFEGGQQTALYIESTKEPEGTLNEQIMQKRSNYFFAFLIIGIFNNNGFTLV